MVGIDGDWVCPSLEEAVSLSAEAEQRLSLCDVLGRSFDRRLRRIRYRLQVSQKIAATLLLEAQEEARRRISWCTTLDRRSLVDFIWGEDDREEARELIADAEREAVLVLTQAREAAEREIAAIESDRSFGSWASTAVPKLWGICSVIVPCVARDKYLNPTLVELSADLYSDLRRAGTSIGQRWLVIRHTALAALNIIDALRITFEKNTAGHISNAVGRLVFHGGFWSRIIETVWSSMCAWLVGRFLEAVIWAWSGFWNLLVYVLVGDPVQGGHRRRRRLPNHGAAKFTTVGRKESVPLASLPPAEAARSRPSNDD